MFVSLSVVCFLSNLYECICLCVCLCVCVLIHVHEPHPSGVQKCSQKVGVISTGAFEVVRVTLITLRFISVQPCVWPTLAYENQLSHVTSVVSKSY